MSARNGAREYVPCPVHAKRFASRPAASQSGFHLAEILSILAILISVAGCQPDHSPLFFGGEEPRDLGAALQGAPSVKSWDLVEQWGALDGPQAFSVINDVAVSRDSVLAVADRYTCRVILIDIPTDSTWSIGGCGRGPGEFQDINALAFQGSTRLWLSDRGQGKVALVNLRTGTVEKERPLDAILPGLGAIAAREIVPIRGDTVLLGLKLLPSQTRGRLLVAKVDFETETLLRRFVADPAMSVDTRWSWGPSVHICGSRDFWAVANEWTSQVQVYSIATGQLLSNVNLPTTWWIPVDDGAEPNSLIAPSQDPRILCTESSIAINHKEWLVIDRRLTIPHSRLVLMDPSGTIRLVDEAEAPTHGSPHTLTLGAILGDLLFGYTTSLFDYPIVRAYRLQELEDE